jgi:hypothetical protein
VTDHLVVVGWVKCPVVLWAHVLIFLAYVIGPSGKVMPIYLGRAPRFLTSFLAMEPINKAHHNKKACDLEVYLIQISNVVT